jgi:hypothetical protein
VPKFRGPNSFISQHFTSVWRNGTWHEPVSEPRTSEWHKFHYFTQRQLLPLRCYAFLVPLFEGRVLPHAALGTVYCRSIKVATFCLISFALQSVLIPQELLQSILLLSKKKNSWRIALYRCHCEVLTENDATPPPPVGTRTHFLKWKVSYDNLRSTASEKLMKLITN